MEGSADIVESKEGNADTHPEKLLAAIRKAAADAAEIGVYIDGDKIKLNVSAFGGTFSENMQRLDLGNGDVIEVVNTSSDAGSTYFAYALNHRVALLSEEEGEIIGRAEYAGSMEDSYFIRYVAADGSFVENRWSERAIRDIEDEEAVPDAA